MPCSKLITSLPKKETLTFTQVYLSIKNLSETVTRRCFVKKTFLKMLENLQKTPVLESLSGLNPANL